MTTSEFNRAPAAGAPAAGQSFFVYLNSGEVRTIGHATSMHLTQDELVICNGEARLTGFPRRDVYFCSGELVSPPSLF